MVNGFFFVLNLVSGITISINYALSMLFLFIMTVLFLLLKKNHNKKKWFLYFKVGIIVFLIAMLIFSPYLSGRKIFCFNNDQYLQYEYFYDEWIRMLKKFVTEGSFPFYSFDSFLGNDFYSSKLYYLTGDVFIWLIYLCGSVYEGLMYQSLLLIILSGIFFAYFLKKFGIKNEYIIIVCSLLYAFSGLASIYIGQYMFHRFYAFFALLLGAMENYREKGKIVVFAISVALCFLSSYYFMFSATVFMPIYYIFTEKYHNHLKVLAILKKSIKLMFGYIIGFLTVAFLLVPGFAFVLNNPRVGSGISSNLLFESQVYVGYVYNFLTGPLTLFSKYGYAFGSGDNGHLTWYSIFVSAAFGPVICAFFSPKIKNRNILYIRLLIVFLVISSLFPPLSSIFHGFSEASFRWMFILTTIFILSFSIFLDNYFGQKKIILDGLLIYGILFIFATIIALVYGVFDISKHSLQITYTIIAIVLMFVYVYLCYRNRLILLTFLCCVEAILLLNVHIGILNSEYGFYEDSLDRYMLQEEKNNDEDKFYRIYANYKEIAPFTDQLNLNQSLNYGYHSTLAYDSTYDTVLNDFLKVNDISWHIIDLNLNNMEVLRMLGVKYYYVTSSANLPQDYSFSYVSNNYHWSVYQIDNYRPLGFTYSAFTDDLNEVANEESWNNKLYISSNDFEITEGIKESESINFHITEYYDDNNIKGVIDVDDKQILFFSIPYNEGWTIKDNGVETKIYNVQGGFSAIVLEPGEHFIELNYMPRGFKLGLVLSAIGGAMLIICFFIECKRDNQSVLKKSEKC